MSGLDTSGAYGIGNIDERLAALGIVLPAPPSPAGNYVPCILAGNLLYLSGIIPLREGKLTTQGTVGGRVSLEEARLEARQVVLNALSIVRNYLGGFDRLKRCVKLTGFVASEPGFIAQPKVLDAASELLFEIMGEAGKHVRSAVGVTVLPLESTVEIEFVFEIDTLLTI